MRLTVCGHTDVGRVREQNEDSYLDALPLIAVADGMGGHRAGEVASELALDVLKRWRDEPNAGPEGLKDAVVQAHRAVREAGQGDSNLEGMGTTLTAAWVRDSSVTVAHVGDSRAYLMRGARLQQLTEDHTLVQQMVDEGKLRPQEAGGHPYKNYLLQALGAQPDVDVEILSLELQPGDRLLIASDGLHGQSGMSEETMAEILTRTGEVDSACKRLVEAAKTAGGEDNITVVLLEAAPDDASSATEETAPVIVSRPASGRHRTPASGRRPQRRTILAAGVTLALVALVAVLVVTGRSAPGYVIAARDGRVAILEGRPGSAGHPATGRVVQLTDVPVASLPETFQRRIASGIAAGSLAEAKRTVGSLPRVLGPTQTPAPSPTLAPSLPAAPSPIP